MVYCLLGIVPTLTRCTMADTVVPISLENSKYPLDSTVQFMQVNVYVKADVLAPAIALRKANTWLSMSAGHLLLAENPELLLREPLQWRFDVIYSVPNREKPGTVRRTYLGRLQMDAISGEINDQEHLIQELTANANALAVRTA